MFSKIITALLGVCCTVTMGLPAMAHAESTHSASALSGKQQSIILIAAFTAKGDTEKLKGVLVEGLQNGMTVNEIKEVLTHLYAYVGFPRSLNGLQVFMEVLEQRRARGITDAEGKAASPLPSTLDRDAYGARVRADLAGQKEIQPPSGVLAFAPVIDTFLKEHLFADIFARDVLDRKARELCTIAALASLPGLGGQLQFHMGGAMNCGLSPEELEGFLDLLAARVGRKEADAARTVARKVLASR